MAITWSTYSAPASGSWQPIAWGNGKFVMAEYGGINAATSPDGVTWTAQTLPFGELWTAMAYGAGVFCIVNAGGVDGATSPDGVTWTTRTMSSVGPWNGVAYGAGVFCAVAQTTNDAQTSPDGITWTARTMSATAEWQYITFGGGQFVAVARTPGACATSPDGITWTTRTIPAGDYWMVAYGNGMYVAAGYACCSSSPDGITWTDRTGSAGANDWYLIAFDGTQFVLIEDGTSGVVMTSPDGITWTADTSLAPDGYYGAALADDGTFRVTAYSTANVFGYAAAPLAELINDGMAMVTTSTSASPVALAPASIALTTTTQLQEIFALRDTIAMTGVSTTAALRLATLSESLGLTSYVNLLLDASINEDLDLSDVANIELWVMQTLVDGLLITGAATGTVRAIAMVSEALALVTTARLISDGLIEDDMALVDTITTQLTAMEELVSAAVFFDSAMPVATVVVEIDDAISLDETLTTARLLQALINEGLRFSVGFTFDDTPIVGLSLNAATKAVSTYTSYPFNSMAKFYGRYYGAGEGGLYELDGDTDAGAEIVWRIRTGMHNLGTGRNKALDAAYLGFTATGKVALKCIVVDASTGEKIVHWYELTETAAVTPRGRRLLVGRGLRSVYWGFELTNVTAGDIELDVIELHPIVLEGRL